MIDSSNNVGYLSPGVPGSLRPRSVDRPAPERDLSSRPRGQPATPPKPEQVEELLQARAQESARSDAYRQAPSDLRARRALAAYTDMQHIEEREYLARVLGIDERV